MTDQQEIPPARRRFMPGEGMPPWIPRALLVGVATVLVTLAGLWVLSRLRGLLFMVFVALFISFALEPAVQALAKRGWRRGFATTVVFLVAGGAILVFLAAIVPLLVSQTAALVQAAPGYLDRIERFLGTSLDLNLSVERLQAALSAAGQQVLSFSADIAGRVVGIGTAVLGFAFRLLTIAMFAFYFVADGPRFRRSLLSMLRPERQREVLRIWEIAVEKTGGYVYSRVLLAAASSVFTWVALRLIGVPYALALSLWVGVMSQFVPVVGTYIAAVLPTLVALFVSPVKALWVVALLVGYQQVENYLIAPRVTARTMAIHPAIAFGSVIAGVALVGGIGAVLALPTAATIQAVVSTAIERHQVVESRHTTVPAARPGSRVRRDRSTRAQPEDPAPTGSSG